MRYDESGGREREREGEKEGRREEAFTAMGLGLVPIHTHELRPWFFQGQQLEMRA